MKVLESLLPEKNKVRLAIDPVAVLDRIRAAASVNAPVHTVDNAGRRCRWRDNCRTSRRQTRRHRLRQPYPVQGLEGFAPPPKEGEPTAMKFTQIAFFQWELTPWKYFPIRCGLHWTSPHGHGFRENFSKGFARAFLDPQSARDLILRGHFEEAMQSLTTEAGARISTRRLHAPIPRRNRT